MSLAEKLVINAAITGMVPTKRESPRVPTTIDEIVACARQVYDAGASIVHFHARDVNGKPTSDANTYTELVRRVRQALPDLIVCVSLSGRLVRDARQRAAPLEARPDLASLTLGSLNFPKQASINSPEVIRDLAGRIFRAGAVPELEVFEPGFINTANYLIRNDILHPPHYFNLILGSLGASPLDLVGLGHMIGLLPDGATWSVGGLADTSSTRTCWPSPPGDTSVSDWKTISIGIVGRASWQIMRGWSSGSFASAENWAETRPRRKMRG